MPRLGDLRKRGGFSIELWGDLGDIAAGTTLIDSRCSEYRPKEIMPDGKVGRSTGEGLVVRKIEDAIEIVMNDGRSESSWRSDLGLLEPGKPHHVVITVDAGPRIIMFVVDGVLCDGGDERMFGWGRFSEYVRDVSGADEAKLSTSLAGLRIYTRPLRTFEAVGNCRATVE